MGINTETEWDPEVIVEAPPLVWEETETQTITKQEYVSKEGQAPGIKLEFVLLVVVLLAVVCAMMVLRSNRKENKDSNDVNGRLQRMT